uniref:Uncharacterized protein n=1 Tax=Chrysotila carterae TaxID=13221 RepID=A0A7S4BWU5_CHRCT|mmetsp:Transcript_20062/g.43356  ORF Transcript_20062/g.43356 Transcript_20062/m.43356 type:complete len:180 (+) Transcript_20062:2-541(+)
MAMCAVSAACILRQHLRSASAPTQLRDDVQGEAPSPPRFDLLLMATLSWQRLSALCKAAGETFGRRSKKLTHDSSSDSKTTASIEVGPVAANGDEGAAAKHKSNGEASGTGKPSLKPLAAQPSAKASAQNRSCEPIAAPPQSGRPRRRGAQASGAAPVAAAPAPAPASEQTSDVFDMES